MERLPAALLALATALSLVVFDVRAEASFDAPRRLAAMLGIAAALTALAFVRDVRVRPWTRGQKAIVACAGGAALLALLSAWLSPHRAVALDALRTIIVFAMIPLIAALAEDAWRWVTHAFVAAAGLHAIVSLGQALGVAQPLSFAGGGGRGTASGLIGNSGLLGLVCALALLLLVPRLTRKSFATWALAAILLAAMAINRSITPFAALLAGLLVQMPWARARAAVASLAIVFAFAATDAATGTLARVDELLSYRIGPWKAAVAMIAERPLLGYGAGSYGAEYARHADVRFANPHLIGSFAQAHNDLLQSAAELGLPAALLLAAALLLLVRGGRDRVVVSILVAGAVASLTWFPLQRPETAMLLLAACGRAWRDA
ncbi:MAG TPA: O-antigen ligase family protein [Thermoanaerobaculia bacterium]|nr:O-antigen ligase family protein [Thermoanaerobaculia bacterium]